MEIERYTPSIYDKKITLTMKASYQKQLLDTFSERLQRNFSNYCSEQKLEAKPDELITYLIDREIIQSSLIKRYAILEAYDDLKNRQGLNKTQVVHVLANRFNITSRSIWNALRPSKY